MSDRQERSARARRATTRVCRVLAAGSLVLGVLSVSACDLAVGPPVQDLGYEHSVGSG